MKEDALIIEVSNWKYAKMFFLGRAFCSTVFVIPDSRSDEYLPTFNKHSVLKFVVEYPNA